jgi:hypothetical protein
MKEAFAKSWPIIAAPNEGLEATAQARLVLVRAVMAVTPPHAANAEDIARLAIDYLAVEERDASG